MTQPSLPIAGGNGGSPVASDLCGTCGKPHQRGDKATCSGHVRLEDGTRRPCVAWPTTGVRVCQAHGGAAPHVKAAGLRRVAEEQAKAMMRTYGLPVDAHWAEALTDELRWALGHVRWLRVQVQAVSPEALVWGLVDELEKGSGEFPGIDVRRAAAPSVWLQLYERERRYLLDVIKAIGATEALDRQIRIAERQGALMYAVVVRVLEGLGLSEAQAALAPGLLEREIEALTGGPSTVEGEMAHGTRQ